MLSGGITLNWKDYLYFAKSIDFKHESMRQDTQLAKILKHCKTLGDAQNPFR